MKKLIFFFLTAMCFPILVHSVDNTFQPNPASWGIQAQFADLTFKQFRGTLFSGQRFISTNSALRFGVSGKWRVYSPNYKSDYAYMQQDSTRSHLDLYLNFIKYSGTSRLKFTWGAGPYLGWAYRYDRTQKSKGQAWVVTARSSEQFMNIGFSGVIGVEYALNSNLSFLAEYMTLFYYQHGRHLNKVIGNFTTTGWHIKPQPAKVGLAIYF